MQINSKNQKILIWSDWHQDYNTIKKIIKHENADINVSLGDEFDSFILDSDDDVYQSAILTKKFLNNKNTINLWGNHSLSYGFKDNRYTKCSGYELRKQNIIDRVLTRDDWDKFKWYVWIDDWFCTHSGIHPNFIHPKIDITNKVAFSHWLDAESRAANTALISGTNHWFYGAGRARSGSQFKGGIVWLDANLEFEEIEGLKQAFGHTVNRNGKIQTIGNSLNIDTMLQQYITITDGKLEIKNYSDIP